MLCFYGARGVSKAYSEARAFAISPVTAIGPDSACCPFQPSSCLSDNDEDEIYGFGYGVYDPRVLESRHSRRQG